MMKTLKKIGLAAALAVGLGIGVAASAQTVGYNIRTGDVWVDSRLGEMTRCSGGAFPTLGSTPADAGVRLEGAKP